ncbi:MAG: hypothetical protein V4584_03070 [Verrucomicrobiota bacterium]
MPAALLASPSDSWLAPQLIADGWACRFPAMKRAEKAMAGGTGFPNRIIF